MAASPRWKIYNADNQYIGCMVHVEDCAAALGGRDGYTIRDGHAKKNIVWTEGGETQSSGESFDHVAYVALRRASERHQLASQRP